MQVSKYELRRALRLLSIGEKNSAFSSRGNVWFSAEPGVPWLKVSGGGQDLVLRAEGDLEGFGPLAAFKPNLADVFDDTVNVSATENAIAVNDNSRSLNWMAREYDQSPRPDIGNVAWKGSAEYLAKQIKKLLPVTSGDVIKPALQGLHFRPSRSRVEATDSYRAAIEEFPGWAEAGKQADDFIVAHADLKRAYRMLRVLREHEAEIRIGPEAVKIAIPLPESDGMEWSIICHNVDNTFPDIDKIFPNRNALATFSVEQEAFLAAIKTCEELRVDALRAASLHFKASTLTVRFVSGRADYQETIPLTEPTLAEARVACNPGFAKNGAEIAGRGELNISVDASPVYTLRPFYIGENYLLMPMRDPEYGAAW